MDKITVEKENPDDNTTVETEGYILLYLEGDKIRATGDISLKTLAPVLTKLALERITDRMTK